MIRNIFPIRIYESKIEDTLFKKIKEDLKVYIENNQNRFTEFSFWIGKTITDFPCTNFFSDELKNIIYTHAYNYLEGMNPETIFELEIQQIWVNINEQHTFQEDHHHLSPQYSQISGTFYISSPESGGNLELVNPVINESFLYSNMGNYSAYKEIVEPLDGKIILFPSYLVHRVTPNETDKTRISISFNLISKPVPNKNFWQGWDPVKNGFKIKNTDGI